MKNPIVIELPSQVLLYENIRATLGASAVIAGAWLLVNPLLPSAWAHWVAVALSGLAVLTLIIELTKNWFQQRTFRLVLDDGVLKMNRGRFIVTSAQIVPGAVLSVDLIEGPLLRRLGLARVRLNGTGLLPEVPPMSMPDAREVQRTTTEQLTIPRRPAGEEVDL